MTYYYYTTLQKTKDVMKAVNTLDDNLILQYIQIASMRCDEILNRGLPRRPFFLPYTEARYVKLDAYHVGGYNNTLLLDDLLLSFTSATINTVDLSSNIRTYPPNAVPTQILQLNITTSWASICNTSNVSFPTTEAVITGVWGYNGDYANAWQAIDTLETVGGINASVTSLLVADVDGSDAYGITPRLSAGNYIKIGSEIMLVIATNTTTNAVTVKRGELGTTASVHLENDVVSRYDVEPIISGVVARQVGQLYARRGAYDGQAGDGLNVTYPPDLLSEMKNILTLYAGY